MSELILTAFIMGLFGSTHCIGMCGGIVGTLSMSLNTPFSAKPKPIFWYVLNYNLGRIISYMFAGLIVGLLSQFTLATLPNPHLYGMSISGLFMVALGLYISQLWMGLAKLELWASPIWQKIQPLAKGFLPPKSPFRALPLGLVWGWLPCGLVYSALPIAYSSGSALNAAIIMLTFGFGTLPMLLLLGNSAQTAKRILQKPKIRLAIGIFLITLGCSQIFMVVNNVLSPAEVTHNH